MLWLTRARIEAEKGIQVDAKDLGILRRHSIAMFCKHGIPNGIIERRRRRDLIVSCGLLHEATPPALAADIS